MFRLLRENIRIGRFGRFGRDFLMSIFDIGDMSKPIIRSNPVFRPIHPKVQSKNAVSKPSNQEKIVQTWDRRRRCSKGSMVFRYHLPANRLQQGQDRKEERQGDYRRSYWIGHQN
jgi:hypothetical protein